MMLNATCITVAAAAPKANKIVNEETDRNEAVSPPQSKLFTLKRCNAVAMWSSWDFECDTCAICRVQLMGALHKLT